MLNRQTLAPHESMEFHEALNFKTLCLAKSKLMQGLVFDQELKALMQKDVDNRFKPLPSCRRLGFDRRCDDYRLLECR